MNNTPGIPNEEHAEALMAEKNREHAKWLATPLDRSGWLDLLVRCQNGRATCLYVLEKIKAEQGLLSNEEVFEALGRAMERGGANIELTSAIILVGDVRASFGNRWNPAQKERAAMVRAKLAQKQPNEKPTSREDESRFRFILSLNQLSEGARSHLLRVESEAELADLKRVALDQQHSDVAASVTNEITRRKTEPPFDGSESFPSDSA